MADWCTQEGADIVLRVKVVPGARRDGIAGLLGDRLKVRVAAPPEGGRANEAVCELLAKALGLPRGAVSIERGPGHPEKLVRVRDADAAAVLRLVP